MTRADRAAAGGAGAGGAGAVIVPLGVARPLALALLDAPPPILVVSDFDGTLAPISQDPMGSRIEPLGRVALRRLARLAIAHPDRLRAVVLSGRGAVDVASRVRVGGIRYHGNHGLEVGRLPARGRAEALSVTFDPRLGGHRGRFAGLADAVSDRLEHPSWLFTELKGPSVAFHYRGATDPDAALTAIDGAVREVGASAAVAAGSLERYAGRMVVEFRPLGAGGKGDAMARLMAADGPGAVLVLGDDRSDAEAFAVVSAARGRGEIEALTVGVHGSVETPPEILRTADVVLAGPHDAARLLSILGREAERRFGA